MTPERIQLTARFHNDSRENRGPHLFVAIAVRYYAQYVSKDPFAVEKRINNGLCRERSCLTHIETSEYRFLDDLNFLIRQVVEFVDQLVNLAVGGVDLTFEGC